MTVFVHSWFRSGSTWLWTKFRNDDRFTAYYEPLNEELPIWTPQRLDGAPVRAFDGDNHPAVDKPYFYEYRDLIASARLGFDKSISYERYLLDENEDDVPLKSYLSGLIRNADESGRRAALCFCRSQLRASWMKANFRGLHIAQIRNLWDQWISFGKHPYFKNRTLLTAYCIEARRPGSFSHVAGFDQLVGAWKGGRRATFKDIDCFAAYVTLWIASSAQALMASDLVIDIDLLGASPSVRHAVEQELERNALPSDLSDCRPPHNDLASRSSSEHDRETMKALAALRDGKRPLMPSFDSSQLREKLAYVSEPSAAVLQRLLS